MVPNPTFIRRARLASYGFAGGVSALVADLRCRHRLALPCGRRCPEEHAVSLIEQAAQRLEQLRNAGIDVADLSKRPVPADAVARGAPPEALLKELEARAGASKKPAAEPPAPQPAPEAEKRESRRVTIDLAKIAKAGVITPDAPRSQLAGRVPCASSGRSSRTRSASPRCRGRAAAT